MITRAEYMAAPFGKQTEAHHAYYGQFVTPELQNAIARHIGADRIKASTYPAFNDLPLQRWDDLRGLVESYTLRALREADPCGGSLGDAVCIAKAAARQIRGF